MIRRPIISAPGLLRRPAVTDKLSFGMALLVGLASLAVIVPTGEPMLALVPFAALGIGALLWRWPVLPVLLLFAGATLIEANRTRFPDPTTELIPLWRNLSSNVPVPFSPAELIIIACGLAWIGRGFVTDTLQIRLGVVLRTYAWYLLLVGVALVVGVASGGNLIVALWEVRTPALIGVVGLLAINLLRTRRHVDALGWIILLGSGIKGVQGTWRYVVTLDRTITYNNLLEHEEALFFPAFYLYLLLLFIFKGSRRQKGAGLLLLPFVLLADFANQRRASTAALLIALTALVVILFVLLVQQRRRIMLALLGAMVLLAGYTGVYWNSHSRLAQPIRAIKSQFIPNSRDESSDMYRELENRALMWQIRTNPVLGRGYGHELPLLAGMWDAREVAPFILYMPHNSVLWVWWRTGITGFTLFWLTIGVAIMHNCQIARCADDPFVRRWAIFAVLVTLMWSILGFLDQGFLLSREIVYVWVVIAVPEVLRQTGPASQTPSRFIGGRSWLS